MNSNDFTEADLLNSEQIFSLGVNGRDRHSFGAAWPVTPSFVIRGRKPPADYFEWGAFRLCAKPFVDVVKAFSVRADFVPVEATQHRRALGYCAMYLLDSLDCMDRERSNADYSTTPGLEDYARTIRHLVLRPEVTGKSHLFSIAKQFGDLVVISDALRDALLAGGINGVCFVPPEDLARKYTYMREGTRNSVPRPAAIAEPERPVRRPRRRRTAAEGANPFSQMEDRLNVSLPSYYRAFLVEYPPDLEDARLRFVGGESEAVSDRMFLKDVTAIEAENVAVRSGGEWTEDREAWPDNYFVIGSDLGGNYWVIDLDSRKQLIYEYDHDTGSFEPRHKSLRSFAAWLLEEVRKFNLTKSADG